jgi:hypothetical protein
MNSFVGACQLFREYKGLHVLNLSRNKFFGGIPATLGNMHDLEELFRI